MILVEHSLEQERSVEYFKDCLSNTNSISNEIMRSVNFEDGRFFTFLPSGVEKKTMYQFRYGGATKSLRNYITNLIYESIFRSGHLVCVIDDYNSTYHPNYEGRLFSLCGKFHENEVYYFLTKGNASPELIKKCLSASECIWHSLALLSDADVNYYSKDELTQDEIQQLCVGIKWIFVTAYDGEGYIIWEKKNNAHRMDLK